MISFRILEKNIFGNLNTLADGIPKCIRYSARLLYTVEQCSSFIVLSHSLTGRELIKMKRGDLTWNFSDGKSQFYKVVIWSELYTYVKSYIRYPRLKCQTRFLI